VKRLILLLLALLYSNSLFAFYLVVGNGNFADGITVSCEANIINELTVSPGTQTRIPIKYLYDPSAASLQPVCRFNSGATNLGSITLRLILNKKDNDIVDAFVPSNNLQKRYAEVAQRKNEIYVYFHSD
jgi:hypothetical protein